MPVFLQTNDAHQDDFHAHPNSPCPKISEDVLFAETSEQKVTPALNGIDPLARHNEGYSHGHRHDGMILKISAS